MIVGTTGTRQQQEVAYTKAVAFSLLLLLLLFYCQHTVGRKEKNS